MKKKILSLLLALTLAFAIAVPASAASSGMGNFAEKKDTYQGFSDVASGAWYTTALKSCYESKLMQGTSSTKFNPQGNLTVAQAIVMAARLRNVYLGGDGTFEKSSPWYQSALDFALSNGILDSTVLKSSFSKLTASATRRQMTYLFAKALPSEEYQAKNTVASLPDVKESDSFGVQIYQLYRAGVLTGSDIYGTFHPNDTITRAAACAIIARAAFPAQRQTLDLYTKYTYQNTLTYAMPAGSTVSSVTGGVQAVNGDRQVMSIISTVQNSGYAGLSITVLTAASVQNILSGSLASGGMTISNPVTTKVTFGKTAAYRMTFQADVSGVSTSCCSYIFISGSTMYLYVCCSYNNDAALLKTLGNAVKVNGSSVSVKM